MREIPFFYRVMGVMWPSFIGAGILSAVIFGLFDPGAARLPGELGHPGTMAFYTPLFFLLWLITGVACWLTVTLGPADRH